MDSKGINAITEIIVAMLAIAKLFFLDNLIQVIGANKASGRLYQNRKSFIKRCKKIASDKYERYGTIKPKIQIEMYSPINAFLLLNFCESHTQILVNKNIKAIFL